jgi:phosphoglycolate phosphatase
MNPVELILFDLDGTLIDSKKDIVACVNRALFEHGRPTYPESEVGRYIGKGIANLLKQLLGAQVSEDEIQALVISFRASYWSHLVDETTVYPGVVEALRHYQTKPKAIVTNKSQALAQAIVEKLGLSPYFEAVFGPEAFSAQKPDPRPLLEACARWNTPPHRAVLVGDSLVDMTAGKNAGVLTVAALYGYGEPTDMRATKPDYEIQTADGLIGLF